VRPHALDEGRLRDLIRREHSGVRAAFHLEVRNAVTSEQLRERPGGTGNSVVWLAWHLARYEDVLVNVVARACEQVLADGWLERLQWPDRTMGIGATEATVEQLSRAIDLDAVESYWTSVHDSTIGWLAAVAPEELEQVSDVDERLRSAPEVVEGEAAWIADLWRGKQVGTLLRSFVVLHGYRHLGEMQSILGRLGIRGL
jgi:hypothetical protein